VPFVAKNVAEDLTAREELVTRTGRMAVPVITVDGEVVVGFDRGPAPAAPRPAPVSQLRCPDCGAAVRLPPATRPGDPVDCPN
jgi:Glutaredoxin